MFKHLKSKLVRVSEHLIYRVYKCCENLTGVLRSPYCCSKIY